MKRLAILVIALIGGAAVARAAVGPVDALTSFLDEHSGAYDRTNAVVAAMEGMLKAIDPLARFCTEPEALRLEERLSGVLPGGAKAPPVEALELWPEGLSYVKVRGFFRGSGAEVELHLRALQSRSGIILDLRGANGTDFASVVALASAYHRPGDRLFEIHGFGRTSSVTHSAVDAAERRAPLLLLTDRHTTQAAELLAALCRGMPGVMLIGTPTGGDARVREVLQTPDGRLLYVATAEIVMEDGKTYAGRGVEPDIRVSPSILPEKSLSSPFQQGRTLSEKSLRDRDLMMRVAGDPVLRRATDILLGLQALGDYGQQ